MKSERIRANLQAAAGNVRRNQKLIRLHIDLPCDFNLEQLAVRSPEPDRLRTLFQRWGFKTMASQLEEVRSAQKDLL